MEVKYDTDDFYRSGVMLIEALQNCTFLMESPTMDSKLKYVVKNDTKGGQVKK